MDGRLHGGEAAVIPAVIPAAPGDVHIVAIAEDGSPGRPVSRREAHRAGVLHLAVSVQLIDRCGLWLLQQRTATKSLFAGRWSNSCCTHPGPGESAKAAAVRSVAQELGLVVELRRVGVFTYRALDPASGLVEHEQDHVFVGVIDMSAVVPNPDHVGDLAVMPFAEAIGVTGSVDGAPWASEVLQRCFDSLGPYRWRAPHPAAGPGVGMLPMPSGGP